MPPLLRIGVFGAGEPAEGTLGRGLRFAGHSVTTCTDPAEAGRMDLVIVDSDDAAWVRATAAALEPHARRGQMFLHTCLSEGTQLFDDIELHGSITLAAHEIHPMCWVTSATDEVGEATVAMLVAEARGMNMPITDALRPRLGAAARLIQLAAVAELDGLELLRGTLPGLGVPLADAFEFAEKGQPAALAEGQREKLRAAVPDAEVAHLFGQLERRYAQRAERKN